MDSEKEAVKSEDNCTVQADSKGKQLESPMETGTSELIDDNIERTENGKDSSMDLSGGDNPLKDETAPLKKSEEKKPKLDDSVEDGETESESNSEVAPPKETVTFKIMFNKQKYDVTFELDATITVLKNHIETITGVPMAMQKLMFKGLVKDEKTLREHKVTNGAKFMLVGSKLNDVLEVNKPVDKKALAEEEKKGAVKEPFSKMKQHKNVIDKGLPDDVMPAIKGVNESLPRVPVSGMVNKANSKVRLTFKLEVDQLWIGTKERTEKLPMNSIKAVVSEPIEGHEEYHMMAIQLGPTEASRYWIYWVPAQYVHAIKDTILGKWQYF